MRFILAAQGAENARRPVHGHVLRALESMGHEVWGFDFTFLTDPQDRLAQWQWMLNNLRPDSVIVVEESTKSFKAIAAEATSRDVNVNVVSLPPLCFPPVLHTNAPPRPHLAQRPAIMSVDCDRESTELAQRIAATVDIDIRGYRWLDCDDRAGLHNRTHGAIDYPTQGTEMRAVKAVLVPPPTKNQVVSAAQHCLDAVGAEVPVIAFRSAEIETLFDDNEVCFVETADEAIAELQRVIRFGDSTRVVKASARLERDHLATKWLASELSLADVKPVERVSVKRDGPRVSFVSAAYNIENYIGPMIESCINQSVDDFEVIITNDGSTDSTRSVIEKYLGDPRIRVIDQDNIGGRGRFDWIFDRGTRDARGELIAMIGGDDISFRERLERQLAVFDDDPRVDMVHSGGRRMDKFGELHEGLFHLDCSYDTGSFLRRHVASCPIGSPSVLVKREYFDKCGAWSSGFAPDYKLNFDTARTGVIRYLPHATVGYRVHDSNVSTGSSIGRSISEGQALRDRELSCTTLADLFPALQVTRPEDAVAATAAALFDLGAKTLAPLASEALSSRFAQRALALMPSLTQQAAINRALYLVGRGNSEQGADVLKSAGVSDALQDLNASHFRSGDIVNELPSGNGFPAADQGVAWDGTPPTRTRILCVVDWNDASMTTTLMRNYFETFSQKIDSQDIDIDLVFITNGASPADAVAALTKAIPSGFDLEQCPRLTLEHWDQIEFIPLQRFALVYDLRETGSGVRHGLGAEMSRLRQTLTSPATA